jgi:hypothetical protein
LEGCSADPEPGRRRRESSSRSWSTRLRCDGGDDADVTIAWAGIAGLRRRPGELYPVERRTELYKSGRPRGAGPSRAGTGPRGPRDTAGFGRPPLVGRGAVRRLMYGARPANQRAVLWASSDGLGVFLP